MTVMTAGMAHISGGIMAAYIAFGVEAQHLLTAVIMTAPGTIMMAKLFVPETGKPKTMGSVQLDVPRTDVNVIDAAARGTSEGLHLALNVAAMLISFIAVIALLNGVPGVLGQWAGGAVVGHPVDLSLQHDLRLGVRAGRVEPWACRGGTPSSVGNLLGHADGAQRVRRVLAARARSKATLDPRSFTIATFALCGFAER